MRVHEYHRTLMEHLDDEPGEASAVGQAALLQVVEGVPGAAGQMLERGVCVSSSLDARHTGVLCLRDQRGGLEMVVRGWEGQSLLVSDVSYPTSDEDALEHFIRNGVLRLAGQLSQSLRAAGAGARWAETGHALVRWLSAQPRSAHDADA